jgi:hypothetical protein
LSTQRDDPTSGSSSLSSAAEHRETGAKNRRFVRAMRLLAGLSALVSLLALWSVESKQLAHDLQLAVEARARPGDRLALRALIFHDVDAAEGPSLALAETTVRLLDSQQHELAKVALTPSPLTTLDGSLLLPQGLAGSFFVEARARYRDTDLVCRRALEVGLDVPLQPLRGRQAGALQQLALGPAKPVASVPAPLLPRVVGGACMPGVPCRMLVWVGQPPAALRVRPDWGVELVGPPEPGTETSDLVELELLVRGLDAQLTLEAHRAGVRVGERAVRLPIGLGEGAILTRDSILPRDAIPLAIAAPPGRRHVSLDFFGAGRWNAVQTLAPGPRDHAVPPAFAPAGLFRVQLRGDLLSSDSSAARVFYVREPGQSDADALHALMAQLAGQPELTDEPTAEWAQDPPELVSRAVQTPEGTQRVAAFLLAGLETRRMLVPLPVSGRPAQLRRLTHTRSLFRFGVAGALALSAVVLALSIARRGIAAADEAQSILDLARSEGENEASSPRPGEVLGARLRVLLLALAVAAAFLAAALLIAAKPLWF